MPGRSSPQVVKARTVVPTTHPGSAPGRSSRPNYGPPEADGDDDVGTALRRLESAVGTLKVLFGLLIVLLVLAVVLGIAAGTLQVDLGGILMLVIVGMIIAALAAAGRVLRALAADR